MNTESAVASRHIFVAGTGRAGTSFLVRYLSELGLDTHVERNGAASDWDDNANAGLEDAPFFNCGRNLPYVIKSPWLYAYIDALIDQAQYRPDAVIIPVRDLSEAATSRSIVERHAIHQTTPWMSQMDSSWEQWGNVPGGIIYSLNPIDQGRLLAVGFHHLVQRLVAADIPLILLAFPRLVEDADYLFDKLRAFLPPNVDATFAHAAHERIADLTKVRIKPEMKGAIGPARAEVTELMSYASPSMLDAAALQRELKRARQQLTETYASRSWRLTQPYRVIGGWLQRFLRGKPA